MIHFLNTQDWTACQFQIDKITLDQFRDLVTYIENLDREEKLKHKHLADRMSWQDTGRHEGHEVLIENRQLCGELIDIRLSWVYCPKCDEVRRRSIVGYFKPERTSYARNI